MCVHLLFLSTPHKMMISRAAAATRRAPAVLRRFSAAAAKTAPKIPQSKKARDDASPRHRIAEMVHEADIAVPGSEQTHALHALGPKIHPSTVTAANARDVIAVPKITQKSTFAARVDQRLDAQDKIIQTLKKDIQQLEKDNERRKASDALFAARQIVVDCEANVIMEYFRSSDHFARHFKGFLHFHRVNREKKRIESLQAPSADEQYFVACYERMLEHYGAVLADEPALRY